MNKKSIVKFLIFFVFTAGVTLLLNLFVFDMERTSKMYLDTALGAIFLSIVLTYIDNRRIKRG